MERTDTDARKNFQGARAVAPTDRGLALFGVLILIVIFTLLGVGAVTLAQRETQNSGSILDIKSRQAGAYAGLVYALGEFQRDPVNFAELLEKWRTKSVSLYGFTPSGSLPPLYLSFDSAGGKVTLTMAKPKPFTVPGSAYKIVVELAGVQVPSSPAADPVIVLRATGTGRSGDEQTVLGAYAVRNIRLNSGGGGAALGITHPFFIKGTGNSTWNKMIETDGGDVYIGGTMHFNSATQLIKIQRGGLKINGNLGWNAGVKISVDSNTWVAGDLEVEGDEATFKRHLVVGGKAVWNGTSKVTVLGSMLIRGSEGIKDIKGGTLRVGSNAISPSQLAVTKGSIYTSDGGATIDVTGDAYFRQITSQNSKVMTLNVTKRLELSSNPALEQDFYGNGTWGQFVARDLKSGSSVIANSGTITIGTAGASWSRTPGNLSLGVAGTPILFSDTSRIYGCHPWWGCPLDWLVNPPSAKSSGGAPAGAGISTVVNADGFDAVRPPATPMTLGMSASPDSVKEVGFNLAEDPSVELKALSLSAGGALCQNPETMCGASLNKARNDAIAAGSNHFHNGYFVAKIESGSFGWDAGDSMTSPLVGKWLILVKTPMGSGADKWPTTAHNADPNNPTNIQFIYVPPTGGGITAGFQPRHKKIEPILPVPFYGYVRVDGAGMTWDLNTSVDFQGAIHFMHATQHLTGNSNSASQPKMSLNQAVLDDIGGAFGSLFLDPNTNDPLAPPGPTGFVATENWIQFQPLSELR